MSLKGDLKMKRILALVLSAILISTLVGCGGNDETTDYSIEYVEAINQSTEQKETYKPDVDELEKNLPGSKYVLYYGSSGYQAECTISFFDDITRNGDVLKGHCKRTWYDGSSSDKVSYKYSYGKLYINQVSDDKIAMGYTDNTYDYIVYKDYLIKDSKIKNVKISSDGSFDALISGYLKFNSDGTVTVKEYKIDDIVIFEEGQYSGTYTRDGNIVTCKTYCSSTNCNNTWYMYIDDYGNIYSDVFVCKKSDSAKNSASTSQTTTDNESQNNYSANNNSSQYNNNSKYNNNSSSNNTSSQSYTASNYTESIDHVCVYSAATCTEPKICVICNDTYGEPSGHRWEAATCTKPKQCYICGEISGSKAEHIWSEATCTEPKKCTVCKTTSGSALGHSAETPTSLICNRCYNAFSPNAKSIIMNIPVEISEKRQDNVTYASISDCSYFGGTNYSLSISIKYNFDLNFKIYAYDDSGNVVGYVSRLSGWYTNGSGVETIYIPINSKIAKFVIE